MHNDPKLDKLLQSKVKVTLFDDSEYIGVLLNYEQALNATNRILKWSPYYVFTNSTVVGFYKSHIKNITVI